MGTPHIDEVAIPWRRPDWHYRAACRGLDPELFFTGRGNNSDFGEAKRVCNTCPVRRECRDYAINAPEPYGCWGGLSLRQRRLIRTGRIQPEDAR